MNSDMGSERDSTISRRMLFPNVSSPRDMDTTNSSPDDPGNDSGNKAHTFLHAQCKLQKDEGKGVEPGTGITAHGREAAIRKLVEKMDLLGEMEPGGKYNNAVLERVPAQDTSVHMHSYGHGYDDHNVHLTKRGLRREQSNRRSSTSTNHSKSNNDADANTNVETRSMLVVKMGFVTIRYGVLVHWNKEGLAELIVLRKKCASTFMKVKKTTAAKPKSKGHKGHKSIRMVRAKSIRSSKSKTQKIRTKSHEMSNSTRKSWWKRLGFGWMMKGHGFGIFASSPTGAGTGTGTGEDACTDPTKDVKLNHATGDGSGIPSVRTVKTAETADTADTNKTLASYGMKLIRSQF